MSLIEKIVNEDGTIEERVFTKEEIKEANQIQSEHLNRISQLEAEKTAKTALLEKLGITEDEAKLLLS